jgi:hypothetical protein
MSSLPSDLVTVAVSVKVFDGIVLATDSATTFPLPAGDAQVYNNANKIFHLHRRLPLGAMTWGLGNIGPASIAELAKDFRARLMGVDNAHKDWALDESSFSVKAVADRLIEFMYDELYRPQFAASGMTPPPVLGFLVAGVSTGQTLAESWLVQMDSASATVTPQQRQKPDDVGWDAFGQPDAVARLVGGYSMAMGQALIDAGVDAAQVANVLAALQTGIVEAPIVQAAMPFADAVGVAKFLVETTCALTRYLPGADTVGGPVELAAITRHEGFKWIARKHYYPRELNPEDPHAPF